MRQQSAAVADVHADGSAVPHRSHGASSQVSSKYPGVDCRGENEDFAMTSSKFRLFASAMLCAASFNASAQGAAIYQSAPVPLPPNVPSLGYQATQTAEFGNLIEFGGTGRALGAVTLVMSDWALASDYGSSNPTWSHPITLNLYDVDSSGPVPAPGSLIATQTQTFAIPWRPEADPTCAGGTAWRAGDGNCYNGYAFTITFDFTGPTVPDRIIYGVAYDTQTWGYAPIGTPGPYNSLNFGLAQVAPTTGSNPFPDTAYWNTETAGNYADGGAAGVGILRQDTNWSPYYGAITFALPPTAPALQSVVSRKVHGAAGTFDVPLSAMPTNPTTEPRIGPAQTLVFTFDKPIVAATATVTEGTASAGVPSFSGNNVIVDLTGVANQQYVTVALSNVAASDGGTDGTGTIRVGYLLGDVNQTRVISVADLGLVNAQLAQAVGAANFIYDVNASGTLSVADKGIVNANLTTALPAP
jgi:hypothetical protein